MPDINYQRLFESLPGNFMILSPDFTIVATSDAYNRVTDTVRENMVGKGIFDIFPADPNDPDAHNVENLTASLSRVLESKRCDTMATQKYNIPKRDSEGGGFEDRYWDVQNCPLLEEGKVVLIIHAAIDTTKKVHAEAGLADKVKELERMNGFMVDREVKMAELKREVETLQAQLKNHG